MISLHDELYLNWALANLRLVNVSYMVADKV